MRAAKAPYYNLMMFPYPSAEGPHIGNLYAYTGADVNGRYWRLMGKDVFEPKRGLKPTAQLPSRSTDWYD